MPSGIGVNGYFGLGRESTWGTAVAATAYAEIMSEGITGAFDRAQLSNIVNRFSEPDDIETIMRVGGPMQTAAWPSFIGHLLRGSFSVLSSSMASGLATHIFTLANSDHASDTPFPGYTFDIGRDVGSAQQYDGNVMSNLEIEMVAGQPVLFNATYIGRAWRNKAYTTPTYVSTPAKPFSFDTASLSVGSPLAATAEWESFRIAINNNIEGIPTLVGTNTVGKIRRTGAQEVRVNGTLGFENITELNNFVNQTEVLMSMNFFRANSFGLLFNMPRFVYTAYPLGMQGRGRQLVSVEGMARYHSGSGHAIKTTLFNTTSSNAY